MAFVASYTAAWLLATLVTAARIVRSRDDSAQHMDDLFGLITNAPIAFRALTPLDLPKRETKATVEEPVQVPSEPLPAAASSSPLADPEPFYWRLWQEMMAIREQGATQIVEPKDLFAGMVRGRHAKPEAPLKVAEVFAPDAEPAVDVEPVVKVAA